MKNCVSVSAALTFMRPFYRSLAQGKTLASCLADDRRLNCLGPNEQNSYPAPCKANHPMNPIYPANLVNPV
jgi:hypothetical protein